MKNAVHYSFHPHSVVYRTPWESRAHEIDSVVNRTSGLHRKGLYHRISNSKPLEDKKYSETHIEHKAHRGNN